MEDKSEIIKKEILKIHHDEVIDKILKEYPLEEGYDIEVISCQSIDARTEELTIKISNKQLSNNNFQKK